MKRLLCRLPPATRNNHQRRGFVVVPPSGAGRKRPILCQQNHQRYFSSPSDYLSPWHFLSPWLSPTTAAATTTTTDITTPAGTSKSKSKPAQQSLSKLWKSTTIRLIDSEIGSLDSFQWHEAERALIWWTSSASSNSVNSELSSWEAVELTFQLIDRLCEEIVIHDIDGAGEDILTYESISLAVHKWQLVLRDGSFVDSNNSSHSLNDEGRNNDDLSPAGMLKKVESYANASRNVRPDATIYNMILSGISKWYLAEEIHTQVQATLEHMTTVRHVVPDSITYTSAIRALTGSNCGNTNTSVGHALAMLQSMKDRAVATNTADYTGDAKIYPTQAAYGAIIAALARSVRCQNNDGYNDNQHQTKAIQRAQQAEDLMREMQDDWNLPPGTLIYSHVLHAWAQTATPEAGIRARTILDSMLQQYHHQQQSLSLSLQKSSDDSIFNICKPNQYCFSSVMTAYAKHGNVTQVQQLLQQLQHLYEQHDGGGDPDMFPNVFCFNALIEAWANTHNHNNSSSKQTPPRLCAQRAEAVLVQMVTYAKQTGREECLPNLVSFNLVLDAFAKDTQKYRNPTQAAQRALGILEHMKKVGLPPDTISYNCVLECLAKCTTSTSCSRANKKWAADTAEHLVAKQMPEPDVISYRNLIRAADHAERAEALLKHLCQSALVAGDRDRGGIMPDRACFNTVITQWSRSKSPQAGQRAEALWRTMKMELSINPDVVTYNAMMECWRSVSAKQPEAANRAWSILRHMQQQIMQTQYSGEEKQTWRSKSSVKPNSISFTTCIWAFAAAKQPEKAEQVFRELEEASQNDATMQPSLISYCALISAWAKVGHPDKAQAIFDALVARSSTGAGKDQDKSLRPNTAIYSTLLHAWATAGKVEQSVAILQHMCDDFASGKNDDAMPDERCFSAVIGALSRSNLPDAAPQAEDCLSKMQEMAESGLDHIRPNIYTYQGVISAWANSDLPIAAERAEELLERLKRLYYKEGDARCRPNVIAYTNTLRAWSRASRQNNSDGGHAHAQLAVERSEALLTEMLQSDLPDLAPNNITYGTVLRTIADSRLPDKLLRAQRIVRIMEEHGAPLDTFAREQLRRAS